MWHLSEQMYKNRTKGINIGLCVSDEASCLGLAGLIRSWADSSGIEN